MKLLGLGECVCESVCGVGERGGQPDKRTRNECTALGESGERSAEGGDGGGPIEIQVEQ